MKEMALGDLHVAATGRTVRVKGQSATKADDLRGTAELFSVRSPEWELTIAHNRWDNGDQDIVLHDRGTAPQRFDRFRSARRLGLTQSRTAMSILSSSCRPRWERMTTQRFGKWAWRSCRGWLAATSRRC